MNRISLSLCLAILCYVSLSCGKQVRQYTDSAPEYFAYATTEDDKSVESPWNWGIMNQDGRVLFADKFEGEPQFISHNRFFVSHHNAERGESYYQLYTLEVEPKELGGMYKEVTPFYDGVALVSRDDKPITLIDTMGRVVVEAINYDGRPVDVAGSYYSGCAYVQQGELYGFVNTQGQVHIPIKYAWITHFRDGYALAVEEQYRQVLLRQDYGKIEVQVLDTSGKVVSRLSVEQLMGNTDFQSEDMLSFFNIVGARENPFVQGRKVIRNESGAVGIISIKGEMLLSYQAAWDFAGLSGDKYICFREARRWGIASLDGEVLLEPKYGYIEVLGASRFLVTDADGEALRGYIIDDQGNRLSESYYYYASVMTLANGNLLMLGGESQHYLIRPSDGKQLASVSEVGLSSAGLVYSRHINVHPTLERLNITDSGIDGKELTTTSTEIASKFEQVLRPLGRLNIIALTEQYNGNLLVDYRYYFPQLVMNEEMDLLTLRPDSLVVKLWTDTFYDYVPTEGQRHNMAKQTLDYISNKGKLISRSADRLVLQSASGTYLTVTVEPGAEEIILVYSHHPHNVPEVPKPIDVPMPIIDNEPGCSLPPHVP